MSYTNEDYIIELLQDAGYLDKEQITYAQTHHRSNETVLDCIIRLNYVSDKDVAQTIAINSSMDFMDLGNYHIPPEAAQAFPADVARRYQVAPITFDGYRMKIAVADPLNFENLDSLPHLVKFDLELVCATPRDIKAMLVQAYGDAADLEKHLRRTLGGGDDDKSDSKVDVKSDDEAPIIKMVTSTLFEAFKARASDIHIEPLEKDLRVRYRIDGVLHDMEHHPKKLHPSIIARLKIMTGTMSIDEKRIPQDGRINVNLGDRLLDLRVSTVPTNHGESIVMRILDKSSLKLGLAELGFLTDDQETLQRLIALPDGILLVTGPTGSGKTTTLYACLNYINKPDRKIITVEDPVEYELPGINQVMVKDDIGMSFAAALRSILRQAPNIIMIGEIRDYETASIAINAALTGHLVFSTLHTNDAPSAVARLTDIGVKPFLISSAVRAIEAQRLVRKLCPECKESTALDEKEIRAMRLDHAQLLDSKIMRAVGCSKCRNNGYRGRLSIVEIFNIDDEVRKMIHDKLSTPALRRRARELGMRTLREDGVRKVLAGMTTAREVIEETMADPS